MKNLRRSSAIACLRLTYLTLGTLFITSCTGIPRKAFPIPQSIADLSNDCHMLALVTLPPREDTHTYWMHISGYIDQDGDKGLQSFPATEIRMIRAKPGTYTLRYHYNYQHGIVMWEAKAEPSIECVRGRITYLRIDGMMLEQPSFFSAPPTKLRYSSQLVAEKLNQSLIDIVKNEQLVDIEKFQKYIQTEGAQGTDYLLNAGRANKPSVSLQ